MNDTWGRIEAWLAAHAPAVLASLNPPATDADIAATEKLIGRALPDDVKAAYRRHDGQRNQFGLFGPWAWMPLTEVRDLWAMLKDTAESTAFAAITNDSDGRVVARAYWHPGWVPFAADGGGDNRCFDLAPGPEGVLGQVFAWSHDHGAVPVLARSFARFLADFADELKAGVYVTDPEQGFLLDPEDG